jgi:hypothetical protein
MQYLPQAVVSQVVSVLSSNSDQWFAGYTTSDQSTDVDVLIGDGPAFASGVVAGVFDLPSNGLVLVGNTGLFG